MERAWIFSSTRWCSLSMYMTPTVTSWSNGSPVRPSKSTIWPRARQAGHRRAALWISVSRAPSNTGVATWMPCFSCWHEALDLVVGQRVHELAEGLVVVDGLQLLLELLAAVVLVDVCAGAARPRPWRPSRGASRGSARCSCGSGTPSGLSTMSTGRPSSRYGMSSSGRMRETTPLLPWRPAILSPTGQLALDGDVDLHHLDDARRQLVALLDAGDLLAEGQLHGLDGLLEVARGCRAACRRAGRRRRSRSSTCTGPGEQLVVEDVALLEEDLALVVDELALDLLAAEHLADAARRPSPGGP